MEANRTIETRRARARRTNRLHDFPLYARPVNTAMEILQDDSLEASLEISQEAIRMYGRPVEGTQLENVLEESSAETFESLLENDQFAAIADAQPEDECWADDSLACQSQSLEDYLLEIGSQDEAESLEDDMLEGHSQILDAYRPDSKLQDLEEYLLGIELLNPEESLPESQPESLVNDQPETPAQSAMASLPMSQLERLLDILSQIPVQANAQAAALPQEEPKAQTEAQPQEEPKTETPAQATVEAAKGSVSKPQRAAEPSVLKELGSLILKIGMIVGIAVLLFSFVYGFHYNVDPSMNPSLKNGDMVMVYRWDKDYNAGDLLQLTFQGENQIRRVIASSGDTVDITDDGLMINGALQQEPGIFEKTERYTEGVDFPLTVGENEVFVLADARDGATDSRVYGAVNVDDTVGTVITVVRRRGL